MSKSDIAVSVRGISKSYTIAHDQEKHTTLAETVLSRLKNPLRRPKTETFWALKDVSFDIRKGEVVGIIGRNGAGKSTLLKILSRITEPTSGVIDLYGRVGSLLEVGTGFHPELTGRENVFLNGAILGMSRGEIRKEFDAIVNFSGIERFLDTPVKRYSSGMYVRLAFAVAAHLDPEVLIVDEVLAVGDLEFQRKCLGKIEQVSREQGRTVLLVSHNLSAISSLCTHALYLKSGTVLAYAETAAVVAQYLSLTSPVERTRWSGDAGDHQMRLRRTWASQADGNGSLHTAADLEIGIEICVLRRVVGLVLGFRIVSRYGDNLAYCLFDDSDSSPAAPVDSGPMKKVFVIPANTLAAGTYTIIFDVGVHNTKAVIVSEGSLVLRLENIAGIGRRYQVGAAHGYDSIFRPLLAVRS
jgi:lipopolysaccharide transport system ATP-binding protein